MIKEYNVNNKTIKVIEDMAKLGWNVVDAKQVKARKEETRGFQKHLVVFRNNDVVINGADGDTVFPQILLTEICSATLFIVGPSVLHGAHQSAVKYQSCFIFVLC